MTEKSPSQKDFAFDCLLLSEYETEHTDQSPFIDAISIFPLSLQLLTQISDYNAQTTEEFGYPYLWIQPVGSRAHIYCLREVARLRTMHFLNSLKFQLENVALT